MPTSTSPRSRSSCAITLRSVDTAPVEHLLRDPGAAGEDLAPGGGGPPHARVAGEPLERCTRLGALEDEDCFPLGQVHAVSG